MENDRKWKIRKLNPVFAPAFYHIWKVIERQRRRQRTIEVQELSKGKLWGADAMSIHG
jgi:hypothetical protein